MRNTREAFNWIIKILRNHRIQFRLSGGFAARVYGSKRKLADIDIDVPTNSFSELLPEIKKYVIFGPARYQDKNWNLLLITLKYRGQKIDLCEVGKQKIFNKLKRKWEKLDINLLKAHKIRILGCVVPIIPKIELIAYKRKILRKVDKEDLGNIAVNTIKILKVKKSDFAGIYNLIAELWPRERFDEKTTRNIFLNQMQSNKNFIIAKMGNKIVGFASLNIKYSLVDKGKIGIVEELVVDHEFRNKGVGQRLLDKITMIAKNNSCKDLVLTSGFHRKGAHKFYGKSNFKKTGYEFYKKLGD